MKGKLFAAALAALTVGTALPAAAADFRGPGPAPYGQDFRGGDFNGGWHRSDITVRTQRGQFTVDRHDRMFYRLTDRPYRFRPGFTYIYTDRCNRDGCMVLEFSGRDRRPTDRFFAPYIRFDRVSFDRDDRWNQDNRDFRGDQRGFDRRSDSRDFRGDDGQRFDDRGAPPSNGYDNRGGQFNDNGYRDRDHDLMGGPH